MNRIPPQSGFQKFSSASILSPFIVFLLVSVVFIPHLPAANNAGAVIGRESKELSSGASFEPGIAADASWSEWGGVSGPSYDPLAGFNEISHAPALKARDLTEFNVEPTDDPIVLDQKMTMLVEGVLADARQARQKADVVPAPTVNGMIAGAEGMYAATDRIYRDIGGMYKEIGSLQTTLDNNYKKFEQDESASSDAAAQFNAASDAMSGRVARMSRAVDGMAGKVTADAQNLGGMQTALEHMGKDGEAALQYYDQLQGNLDTASRQYKIINSALREQDPLVYPSADAAGYFKEQKDYLRSLKTHVQNKELNQLGGARQYLTDAQGYQQKVFADLRMTQANLQKEEDYFRKAKVGAGGRELLKAPSSQEEGEENVCAGAEPKGLDTLRNCAKSCRTVCRWKEKVAGQDCYECPSGSPDTCYDVGAWPADHPWCQPGGICYSDPMMYCVPFGTKGPQGERLQCTNCKQRQDMCWQKAGGGMTYTNCKRGCWNGKCVFKGKYQEFEWDGRPEFIHCYECKTPPPAPTCEELGWGYDWQADCEKDCPDPGVCEEKTMPPRKGPKPPTPIGGPGGGQGGQDGGGAQGGQQGGDTGARSGGDEEGPDGKKLTPPTGTPEQPTGGGGSVAGGPPAGEAGKESPPTGGGQPPTGTDTGQEPQKPDNPGTTAPNQPEKPKTEKPEVTDADPPPPPDNQEIGYLRTRIAQLEEKIKDREEIINDPREGDGTKTQAASQLDSYQKELERLKAQLKEEEEKELERQRKAAEEKAGREAAARERDRTRTRWPDPKVEMQKIRIKELKEAIDQLKTRAQEIKDMLAGRREHIDRLNREIDLLEREIQHHKDASESGGEDATHARDSIENIEKELARKKSLRDELDKKLKEAQRQHAAELETLKRNYQRKFYAVDENARRKAETERIDEYFNLYTELEHVKASRDERNRAFEEKFRDMESRIAAARAAGDEDTAGKLEEQLENMKRGKADWDRQYESQVKNLEDQLYEMGYHRNFDTGVGPTGKDTLAGKLDEYGKIFDSEIAATEKKINELEGGSTMTREQGEEAARLRARLDALRASREGITEKQNILTNGYKLPEDIAENIRNSTDRYAEGSKNVGADKSFARLFTESLAEEAVHNMNPLVAAKKSVAFGWGMVKGVGTAVKGLADLGYEVVDTLGERIAVSLGFESGGIFGTEGIDALDSAFSTLYSNANFDGIIKATVALGGAIDAKLKQLEKSGDIDWATSEFGGEVAGELVVGDAVIAGAVGKAGTLLRGADEAVDAARAAGKLADDVPTGSVAAKADDLPGTRPHDTPPSRGPPEARPYNNNNPLPSSGKKPTQLADDVLENIETNQGFKKEHAQRMNEFAQEHDAYLLVRDGNPESVKFFDDPDMMPKPMSSKAKTAKVGPESNRGLVVNPSHPVQSGYWDDAIAAAKKSGNADEVAWLEKNRQKAVETWNKYATEMLNNGYQVNPRTGVVEYVEVLPDGSTKTWKGIHGDYDLHGAYRKAPDGTMENVSFGSGQKFDANGLDVEGGALRQQLNDKLTGGNKDFVQHGGQDDWVPDPHKVPNKPPDPPVTVFFPDGRPPVKLKNAAEMKTFYEGEMGVQWPYPEPTK